MRQSPRWIKPYLTLAATWNLALGAWLALAPQAAAQALGLSQSFEIALRTGGWISLLFGVMFLIAHTEPVRHWLLVLAGATAKVVLPGVLFFSGAALTTTSGWLVLGVEAAMIGVLGIVLAAAERCERQLKLVASPEIVRMALRAKTQNGVSLYELSAVGPTMIVFLRQLGCPFCREMLYDLGRSRSAIEAHGTSLALIHMADESVAATALEAHGLADLPRVRDENQALYRAFGLPIGRTTQLFGVRSWLRVFPLLMRHGIGKVQGNGLQMPGVFVLFHGEVLKAFRHQSIADRPNYVSLASEQDYPIPS